VTFLGHAFVDWDDTIAEGMRYFHEAEVQLSERIGALTGHFPQRIRQRGGEIDVQTARRIGLVKESFGIAWTECYREFCALGSIHPEPEIEREIQSLCTRPYEVKQDLIPGAPETLLWLNQAGFEVTIWTAGDQGVQSRKIAESGLEHLVHRIVVVPDKTTERLHAALGERDRVNSFVVGNSMYSDIKPALSLSLLALHIPQQTWAYDQAQLSPGEGTYRLLQQITEVPAILRTRFQLAG
jgi:putative hydrolase of the HAD superfamily